MSKQTFIVEINTDKDTFEERIKEHNKKVRADAIEEFRKALIDKAEHLSVGSKSVENSLTLEFERIAEQVKEEERIR